MSPTPSICFNLEVPNPTHLHYHWSQGVICQNYHSYEKSHKDYGLVSTGSHWTRCHKSQWRTGNKGTIFDKVAEWLIHIKKNSPLLHFLLFVLSFSNLHIYRTEKRIRECNGQGDTALKCTLHSTVLGNPLASMILYNNL